MIPTLHSNNRKIFLQRGFLLITALILIVAFCSSPVTARDVKVALTELKPTLYTDDQGKPVGFIVDLIEDLAAREDWNLIWIRGTIAESLDRLASDDIDLLPAVTVTQDRAERFDFNNESVLSIWSEVYAKPGSGINTILDLDGKMVAMVRGASSGIAFRDYAEKFGVNATYLEKDTPDELFVAVVAGEADALVVYNSAGHATSGKYGLVGTPVMFNPAQFGFAVLKGKNQDLLKVIDPYIAEGKNNPSSVYSQAMQRWYGIRAEGIIPTWLLWGLGGVACLAALFVIMSYILRREVRHKTAELSLQNEKLQSEVENRTRAEMELVQINEELRIAYEQLAIKEEELRENFQELMKSENALMQARKKLNLLNTLTGQDIKNSFFTLSGYIQLSKDTENFEEVQNYLKNMEQTLQYVENTLAFSEKFQNLGINQPRWQTIVHVLLYAISHLDFSKISRTIDLPDIEIYADPLLEDVFLSLMKIIDLQGACVTRIGLRFLQNANSITILVESDGSGIPAADKENVFTWEHTGKGGTSLFLAREILSITEIALQETGDPDNGICFEITVPKGGYRMKDTQE